VDDGIPRRGRVKSRVRLSGIDFEDKVRFHRAV
jgi:hypothetical protein